MKINQTNYNQMYSQQGTDKAYTHQCRSSVSVSFTQDIYDRRISGFNSSQREKGIMKIVAPVVRIIGAAVFGFGVASGFKNKLPSFDLTSIECIVGGAFFVVVSSVTAISTIMRAAVASIKMGKLIQREDI